MESSDIGSMILHGMGLVVIIIYQFLGISILCDEYLCPVIEKLCDQLKLSTAVAGATLVAFGSSAPEIVIGVCGAASNKTALSIPTILVSAMIAFGLIPALVVMIVGTISLECFGVLRDAVAYALALALLMYFISQEVITQTNAFFLFFFYFVYVFFIWKTSAKEEMHQLEDPLIGQDDRENGKSDKDEDEENDDGCTVFGFLARPFEILFNLMINEENPRLAFAACMVFLALLSEGSLYCASWLAEVWRINPATAGMTLLAFGGQVPDTIASVELARSGMPDAAVSQAVASQVINITLGLGMPFFMYSCITGRPTEITNLGPLKTVASSVLVTIVAYIGVVTPGLASLLGCGVEKQDGSRDTHAVITKGRAILLMSIFAGLYTLTLVIVESQDQDS